MSNALASSSAGPTSIEWRIGGRYLNTKTRQPLTLRYIGPLPPASSSTTQWLGVEYDDPAHGRGHSGIFEGQQVFRCVQEGAGAFIRVRKGDELGVGPTLIQAIKERYDLDSAVSTSDATGTRGVILGNSGHAIVVETPGMGNVQKRLRDLGRLRQIGLEGQYVFRVGGTEAERADFRQRLKGVELLDIAKNLLETWSDVAEIVNLLPGLKTLIINDSRLSPLEIQDDQGRYTALRQLKELHLARSSIDWDSISFLGPLLPELEELHLPGNPSIGSSTLTRPLIGFEKLKVLNLETCGLKLWSVLEHALAPLSALETLNISGNPLSVDIDPDQAGTRLGSLRSLILLNTPITRITDLANLASRIPGVQIMRYSIDPNVPLQAHPEGSRLTGNVSEDRSTLIAIFPGLRMLNGTEVRPKERDEAERRYLQLMAKISEPGSKGGEWRIYDTLAKKHGKTPRSGSSIRPAPAEPQPQTLRSKLITLHVYANDGSSYTMTSLPSAPVSLLRRKIAKKTAKDPEDLSLYTVRRTQSDMDHQAEGVVVWVNEKVTKVEDGEVGYWFEDGDGVMVESA